MAYYKYMYDMSLYICTKWIISGRNVRFHAKTSQLEIFRPKRPRPKLLWTKRQPFEVYVRTKAETYRHSKYSRSRSGRHS